MNKDSEKIFENYLAAGMIPMDKLEEEEAPQAPQPEAEAGAADPGSMLAGIIAEDPNSIAELAGLAEVQQWIQSKSQATQPAAPVPAAPAQAAPAPAPAQ